MQEIVQRFAEEGYMIDPKALELIGSYPGPLGELVEGVIRELESSTLVVGVSEIERCPCWSGRVQGDDGSSHQRSSALDPTPSDRRSSSKFAKAQLPSSPSKPSHHLDPFVSSKLIKSRACDIALGLRPPLPSLDSRIPGSGASVRSGARRATPSALVGGGQNPGS